MAEWEVVSEQPAEPTQQPPPSGWTPVSEAPAPTPAAEAVGGAKEFVATAPGKIARQGERARAERRRQYGYEEDIDYHSSAPFNVQVELEKATPGTDEEKLALAKHYKPEDFGQDKKGRWWVRNEDGKKVAVNPGLVAGLAASAVPTGGAMVGTVAGGQLGALGGPLAPFTIPGGMMLGGGLGWALGQGAEDVVKATRGTYALTPQQELDKLLTGGGINALLSGLGPAGRALSRGTANALRTKAFGVTPESAATGARLVEGGALPTLGSIAPEATGIAKKQELRNIISGNPTMARNVEYSENRMRNILGNEGATPAEINAIMTEARDPQAVVPTREAGRSLVAEAQRRVAAAEASIAADREAARVTLANNESLLRQWADTPTPRLGAQVNDAIEGVRRAFGERMSRAYTTIDQMTGAAPVVPMGGAIDAARRLFVVTPPNTLPPLIAEIAGRDLNSLATIEAAHELRSQLRQMQRGMTAGGNLTPGIAFHQVSEIEEAINHAFGRLANSGAGLPQEAASALRATDAQYASGIARFNNATLRKIHADARDGIFSNPEKIAAAINAPGEAATARLIMDMLPPQVRTDVARADMRSMIAEASRRDPATGNMVLDGIALAETIAERRRTTGIDQLYNRRFLDSVERLARENAALGGKLEITALQPSAVRDQLARANVASRNLEAFVADDPIGALSRTNRPQVIDMAVRRIARPGDEAVTAQAMATLGRQSPEWGNVQRYALRQLFQGAFAETPSLAKVMSGEAIEARLAKYTKAQQDMLFQSADDIRLLAKDMRFLFPPSVTDYASSQAAVSVTSKSYFNPYAFWKRINWNIWGYLADRPAVLNFMADNIRQSPSRDATKAMLGAMGRWIINQSDAPSGTFKRTAPELKGP